MKKRTLFLTILLAAALIVGAFAAGGGADDPFVSLDYLQNVFAPKAEKAAQEKLDASGSAAYAAADAKWRAAVDAKIAALNSVPDVWGETRVKGGDTLTAPTGAQFILLAGEAAGSCSAGAVVDVTDGTEFSAATALVPNHRYLVAEDAAALFAITSRTAVVLYCGGVLSRSGSAPDCNAMADALKSLSLFRGTGSGVGSGYELERAPTRVEALVMLIRMLGEENEALASAAAHPFRDVPAWADRYVAYAYERGYTNGVSATEFAPALDANAGMYVEFVLRALGYSDTTQTDVSTAADRALGANVITAGEHQALSANVFLRADAVYLSWYALGVPLPGGLQSLHEKLEAAGVFSAAAYDAARALVTTPRL